MITQGNSWTRMHALAQRARLAGTRRQRLDVRLSPEESALLADVLEAALQFMSAVTGRPDLDDATPTSAELSYLAMEGGGSVGWPRSQNYILTGICRSGSNGQQPQTRDDSSGRLSIH